MVDLDAMPAGMNATANQPTASLGFCGAIV
jgi:hypothetical protein